MGARLALCLPLLMLATPEQLSAQAIQDSRCYLMNGGAVESFFISEDTPVGSVIGTLSVNGDPRVESGDITLRVQEKGAGVALAPGTKNITLVRALDREERAGPSNLYVNVRCDRRRTTDPSFIIPVSVRVWDVNDNAPAWVGAPYRARVTELAAAGARLVTPRATDSDQPGPHATLHYSVLPSTHSDLVRFAHELESAVVVSRSLDYESLQNFTVTLRAQDGGSPPLHADTTLYVEVLDADDQNPAFTHEHYTAVLPTDPKKDSVLVTSPGPISAADQDLGINAPIFYTTSGDNKNLVTINRDSGQVSVTDQLMAITQPVTIVIKATQVDNADRYALATLGVSPLPPSPSPSPSPPGGVMFQQAQYHVSVSEATAPGAVLHTLHTLPHQHTRGLQFFVSDRGFLDQFAINSAGQVVLRRALDYETSDHYHYQVMVTDGTSNDTASLNITVTNVNEWEPRFRYPQYEFRVEPGEGGGEGGQGGQGAGGSGGQGAGGSGGAGLLPVGKLDVFDGDKADTVTLSVRGPDANMVYINSLGEMFLRLESLATRNTSVLHVLATAVDSGHPPKQTSVPVLIHLPGSSSLEDGPSAVLAAGGAALTLLALLLAAGLLIRHRSRRSKPSPAPVSKPYVPPPKPRSPPSPSPGRGPPALPPPGSPLGAPSGSLQSVSAGASTILANSNSSLDLRDSLQHNGTNGGGTRGSKGKVAPLPPPGGQAGGLALMSDHLAGGGGGAGGRSGVAWPSATIPARVKKLSWDDAAPADNKDSSGRGAGAVEAANTARHDHMNLTVYF